MELKKLVLMLWYFLSPLIPFILFWIVSPPEYHTPLRLLVALMSFTSYTWLVYEFVLTARPRFIDQTFGMDNVIKFHIIMSIVSVLLGYTHGLILTFTTVTEEYQRATGIISTFIYVLLMILGYLFLKNPKTKDKWIEYRKALVIHNFTMVATILLYIHLLLSSMAQKSFILLIVYSLIFLFGFLSWLYLKSIRPVLARRNSYQVTDVISEVESYWTINLKTNKKRFTFKPGQYAYVTFKSDTLPKETHPFTIASSPTEEGILRFTIKELGDYTNKIGNLKKGDFAIVEGPYGVFNPLSIEEEELVFIAGGVGITPFLSVIRYLKETKANKKITLIWGIRKPEELFLSKEFDEFKETNSNFTITPVVSDDDSWVGECGFIDLERLEHLAACEEPNESKQSKAYFICGPPLMVKLILPNLKKMGVSKKYVHIERFS